LLAYRGGRKGALGKTVRLKFWGVKEKVGKAVEGGGSMCSCFNRNTGREKKKGNFGLLLTGGKNAQIRVKYLLRRKAGGGWGGGGGPMTRSQRDHRASFRVKIWGRGKIEPGAWVAKTES